MGESSIFGIAIAPWAPVIAAYVFGIATGWLIWGGPRPQPKAAPGHTPANGVVEDLVDAPAADEEESDLKAKIVSGTTEADPCPPPMKLGALESEIRTARELLEQKDEEAKAFTEELSTLDAVIKRANGRLKLVLRAITRATLNR